MTKPTIEQQARRYRGQAKYYRRQRDELLSALEAIERLIDGSQPKDYPGALMVARAAIAKARGDA